MRAEIMFQPSHDANYILIVAEAADDLPVGKLIEAAQLAMQDVADQLAMQYVVAAPQAGPFTVLDGKLIPLMSLP